MVRPLVSILLPSLNARRFLGERIDSLLAQTMTDWEAIVLDSHSTDGSWEFFESIAATDSRFRLYQVSPEGLYAAINRGIDLATGEFMHVATCDDSMGPQFLTEMLEAFAKCPQAGMAACDALLIDQHGNKLSAAQLPGHMSRRTARNLLETDIVRTAFSPERELNYRPVPHDCLLHFAGRSVYFSLNQLVMRVSCAKATGPFETKVGSIADFGWLVRLTSRTGTVHLPKRLAMWRLHGDQLSLHKDESRPKSMKMMSEPVLTEVYGRKECPLTRNDRGALLLPIKTIATRSTIKRIGFWFESLGRLLRMLVERPSATFRVLRRERFRFGTRRHSLLPMIFEGIGLAPIKVESVRDSNDVNSTSGQ